MFKTLRPYQPIEAISESMPNNCLESQIHMLKASVHDPNRRWFWQKRTQKYDEVPELVQDVLNRTGDWDYRTGDWDYARVVDIQTGHILVAFSPKWLFFADGGRLAEVLLNRTTLRDYNGQM